VKVAVLSGPRQFDVVEEQAPEVGPGQVLVRVANCGVCTSELDMWEGAAGVVFPHFPGHEVSGIVERVGHRVTTFRPGEKVAVWVTQRGFAEYVAVDAEHCLPAGNLPLDQALAEPVACAVNAVELCKLSLGDDVLIVGAGFMGHLVHKLVELKGPRNVIVADTRADALRRAESFGAVRTVNVSTESLTEAVAQVTGGEGVDISIEVTGAQAPLLQLGDVTRMSGKIAIVGYHQGPPREIPLGQWNWMAFRIINAHFREASTIMRGMRTGMRLLTSGRLSLDGWVTHAYSLGQIDRAFETAHTKPNGFVKATVRVASEGDSR
jgi:2-desacetyl-2-hydroxyethyl bacteriochlorophyllide A dehydrogenase